MEYPLACRDPASPGEFPVGEAALVINPPPAKSFNRGGRSVFIAPQPARVEQRRQPRHAQIQTCEAVFDADLQIRPEPAKLCDESDLFGDVGSAFDRNDVRIILRCRARTEPEPA